jgi:uncharacterized protein (TIGR02246 family)
MRRTATVALLALALAGPLSAGLLEFTGPARGQPAAPAGAQDVRQAADQLAHEYDAAFNSQTSSAMASLYTPDGILVPPGRAPLKGRTAIMVYYQGRFDHGVKGHATRIDQAYPLGDGGFAVGQFRVEAPEPDGTPHELHGNLVYVLQHRPEGWKLRLVMASPTPGR